jgi:hypothetical protein
MILSAISGAKCTSISVKVNPSFQDEDTTLSRDSNERTVSWKS